MSTEQSNKLLNGERFWSYWILDKSFENFSVLNLKKNFNFPNDITNPSQQIFNWILYLINHSRIFLFIYLGQLLPFHIVHLYTAGRRNWTHN